jgi:hypothetical protein
VGAIEIKKQGFKALFSRGGLTTAQVCFEGLYKSSALDKMICADKMAVKRKTVDVGFVSIPLDGIDFFKAVEENAIL